MKEAKRERRDRFGVLGDIWISGAGLELWDRFRAVGQIWSCGAGLEPWGRCLPEEMVCLGGGCGTLVQPHPIPRGVLGIPVPRGERREDAEWSHSRASLPFLPEEAWAQPLSNSLSQAAFPCTISKSSKKDELT